MLPPNLLIVSMVVFLATTVSMAPVEEQEQEEVEVEATEEGELSEEEEDDDDSQSQDKFEGLIGMQQTTMAVAAAVAVASGGSGVGAAVSSNIHHLSASSSQSAGGRPNGGTAGSSSAGGQSSSAASQPTGPDGVHSESNGNGQKLLNGGGEGGGRGGADSQTGVLGSFGGGVSQLDYTGECPGAIDPSSHDFLLGLMGGGDPFKPDHMTPPPQLDSAGPAHHSDISIDQSGPGHTSLISGPDQSQSSSLSVSGHSHSAAQGDAAASTSSLQSEAHRVQTDGADSPDTNGNGRQTLLTDTNAAGGAESVSGLHIDLTASGLGLTHDVTGGYSHTDLVTMATDSTGTDTVPADPTGTPLDSTPADPTGTPLDSSHPAVTDHTQMAGSVTEQYNPSGQGPEGAENVELEDTC
ncbi:uncharacterized protein LOC141754141 isoform X3 [Sebastes fasciatus]|uniref:uncharacterized protein LOC141754141 isoform X3 n=1 Tax=Sebastes fasciatus TaxID=394691 RepID=UPI003D9F95B2